MKNKIDLFRIIAFIAVMGLVITACDNGNASNDLYDLYRNNKVTIIGTARVGQKLTVISNGNGFKPGSKFEWLFADTIDPKSLHPIYSNLSGPNDSVLTITSDLLGKYIKVWRDLAYIDPKDPKMGFVVSSGLIGPVTN